MKKATPERNIYHYTRFRSICQDAFEKKVGGKSFFFEKDLTKELVYGIIQVFRSEESFAKVVAGVAQWQSS